ncbi:MAG TPA: hypothetical protein VF796_15460 [Humisphaera sp.]
MYGQQRPHDPPPPVVDYARPYAGGTLAGPPGRPVLQFFGGLGAGFLFSLVLWVGLPLTMRALVDRSYGGDVFGSILLVVVLAKLVAGIVFLCLPGRRLIGGGILVSMALVVFVFISLCFGFLAMH